MSRILSVLLALFLLVPTQVRAESEFLTIAGKRGKVIGKAALYGTGGGLVVGLATQVFKKKAKNIFVCGSLGMYAGIILGIYVISTSRGPTPYEGPDTYEDFSKLVPEGSSRARLASNSVGAGMAANGISVGLVNFSF